MRIEDLAWAAGLFEGEGTWGYQGTGHKNSVRAELAMTDHDIVRRFHEVIGVGKIVSKKTYSVRHKEQIMWRVTNRAGVVFVLKTLRPWLGKRRIERGEEILRLQEERWTTGGGGRYQLEGTMREVYGA